MVGASELELYIPQTKETPLDTGADSSVYKITKDGTAFVVKLYKPNNGVDLNKLQLYQQVTNGAARLINDQQFIQHVNVAGQNYRYRVLINPVELVGVNPQDPKQVVSVSRFIPGPRLVDPLPSEVPFKQRDFTDPVSLQLEQLSDRLNGHFGVKGILILEPNVKFSYNPTNSDSPILLTVTDLSSHLWAFGPANQTK